MKYAIHLNSQVCVISTCNGGTLIKRPACVINSRIRAVTEVRIISRASSIVELLAVPKRSVNLPRNKKLVLNNLKRINQNYKIKIHACFLWIMAHATSTKYTGTLIESTASVCVSTTADAMATRIGLSRARTARWRARCRRKRRRCCWSCQRGVWQPWSMATIVARYNRVGISTLRISYAIRSSTRAVDPRTRIDSKHTMIATKHAPTNSIRRPPRFKMRVHRRRAVIRWKHRLQLNRSQLKLKQLHVILIILLKVHSFYLLDILYVLLGCFS